MPTFPFCDQLQLDPPWPQPTGQDLWPDGGLQAGEHPVSWPGMGTAQTRQPGSSLPQKYELGITEMSSPLVAPEK